MGTDVYLYWKGMTEEEKKAQYTGFEIYSGNVGYLRASIGMHDENEILRQIFPPKYWGTEDPQIYDFNKNYKNNIQYIMAYIMKPLITRELSDKPVLDQNLSENTLKGLYELYNKLKQSDMVIQIGTLDGIDAKIKYASSVIDFLWLGKDKQDEKKEPTVYISY